MPELSGYFSVGEGNSILQFKLKMSSLHKYHQTNQWVTVVRCKKNDVSLYEVIDLL